MDSNFAGMSLEQWQEVNGTPFEELEELPCPAASFEENPEIPYEESQAVVFGEMEQSQKTYYPETAEGGVTENMDGCGPVTEEYTETTEAGEFQEPAEFDSAGTEEAGTQKCEAYCDNEAVEIGETESEDIPNMEENPDEPVDEELEEERKRAAHEASEAKRKAEWEARQQEKKDAEKRELDRLECMPDEEAMTASMQRVSKDTERLTRRNMKDCVSEYIQTLCLDDATFARLALHPRKSMVNCFRYINRKARAFVEQEMKDNDIKPEVVGVYGSDVPDDLCYQWAEEYFRDPDVQEDKPEKEETFEPIPYRGKSGTRINRKKPVKKTAEKKAVAKKTAEEKKPDNQESAEAEKDSVIGQMSLMDLFAQAEKVG